MSNPIVKALEHGATKLGKTLGEDAGKAVKDLYHSAGHKLKKVAKDTAETDTKHARELDKILKSGEKDVPHGPHAGKEGHSGTKTDSKGTARENLDDDITSQSREPSDRTCKTDPVDVATGRMVLPQTDVVLPALLPLAFERFFESSYRAGRWFGPTWTSTADQRLEIDAEGVIHVAPDGALLCYPHPAPDEPTLPAKGARRPLEIDEHGEYTLTDPASGRVLHFDAPADGRNGIALLAQISDRTGQWITFSYDAEGAPSTITHSGGYRLKLTTEDGRITALHLAGAAENGEDAEIVRFGYDEAGHLASVTNSSGTPTRYGTDALGRVTSWTDTNDSSFGYVYDERDRCISQGGPEGHLANTFTYSDRDPDTGLTTTAITNSLGHTSRYLINAACQVAAEIDPAGAMTRTTYNDSGAVESVTDPLGHTTQFAYDGAGHLTLVVRPDGHYTSAAHNDLGHRIIVAEADGSVWHHTYDERGNPTSLTDPTGARTTYAYSSSGHLASITDALGATTALTTDRAGLPLTLTDPLGATSFSARDAFGRTRAVTDALGHTSTLTWSVEGRLTSRTAPDGTTETWAYDGEGNCTHHTDPLGQVTTYEYTHFDLPAARTDPDGARYTFEHDTELRLTQVTNPQNLTWSYVYSPAGRLISETDFDARTQDYTHDAAGRLATRTTPLGETISLTHDALGNITTKNAAGNLTHYTYDLAGRPDTITGVDAQLHYVHNALGRVTAESVNGRTIAYTYDALGRRTSRTTPTGALSRWSYDAAGNRTTLTTSGRTLAFTHDGLGQELTRTLGDTLTFTSTWDPLGRLTAHHTTNARTETLQHRAYTYRADGNPTAIDDRLNGPRRFTLDQAGRVTSVSALNWSETYAYDTAGNQTHADWPDNTPAAEARGDRTYTGTRITRAGTVRYEHDDAGRTTLRQKTRLSRRPDTWHYTWDTEDRLTTCTTPGSALWRYLYDPLGRRMAKQRLADDGHTVLEQTDFTWDGTTLCEQTTHGPDTRLSITWDHQGLSPLTQRERLTAAHAPQEEIDERFFTIVTDLVGTPTELLDETGAIAARTRNTLWGSTVWNRDATTHTPLRFPGQYFDSETQLHHNYFRTYDPETARYLTADPLGLAPGPNPAVYVHNPHTWSDPFGLAACHLHGGDTGSPGGPGIVQGPAPQHAADMLDRVNGRTDGIGKVPGYNGNQNWGNNLDQLPGGKYKEWDVNAKSDLPVCTVGGCGKEIRGPERLLTPKDGGPGPAYYTPDHYGTFYYVGEFTG
ncbi:DUF6531 domain-containing protein [Streptomyces sp. NPDC050738]|uniref:DUF6531 domain-containing protein n=1 Tax=Streptomyces sp. NPDC050738 TaxID=3154744 RepID=UPI0034125D2A